MYLDKNKPYIFTIDDVLDTGECLDLIAFIDANEPKPAPVNTAYGEKQKPDVRNNERVFKNDSKFADQIFQRVKPELPDEIFDWKLLGLNELFRCYRYKPGMRFAPHSDGAYRRNENELSFYTFLIYLNSVEEGGETSFVVEPELQFTPKPGLGLLFQHPIVHEGCEVISGIKYVIRTDVMYQKDAH